MNQGYQREMWEGRYGADEYIYGTAPNDFLASVVDRIPKGRVLSIAEGEGRNGVFLAERGYSVVGVDGSPSGLQKARRLAESRGVSLETQVADLGDFVIEPGGWNGIVSIFAHLPVALRERLHRQVVDGLAPNGVFVLEAYTPAQIALGTGGPPDPALTMTLAALRRELAGLDFIIAQEIEREIHEGRYHRGKSAVVQVVACKPPKD